MAAASVADVLLCAICTSTLTNPVRLDPCDHYFCKDCVEPWLKRNRICPVDRAAVVKTKAPDRLVASILEQLAANSNSAGSRSPQRLQPPLPTPSPRQPPAGPTLRNSEAESVLARFYRVFRRVSNLDLAQDVPPAAEPVAAIPSATLSCNGCDQAFPVQYPFHKCTVCADCLYCIDCHLSIEFIHPEGHSFELLEPEPLISPTAVVTPLSLPPPRRTRLYNSFPRGSSAVGNSQNTTGGTVKACTHICALSSNINGCCFCMDARPETLTYHRYVDGIGDTRAGLRSEYYCVLCKGRNYPSIATTPLI
ncbi:hypothetical protein BDR26DRAFT_855868 [Obelidium mucronatum]|nr:hypothetical protein BDR26DRAFT_855868 [Obelidium mucronatum]